MLGVDAWVVAVLAVTLLTGAVVQGTVGLGLGMVAAPVCGLVAPGLVPELLLWLALAMASATLVTERRGVDWRGLGLALPSRVVGTGLGVWVVAVAPPEVIGIAVGVMVLASVLVTWRTVVVPVNRATLPVAGFVSGVSGTATSIGGPPMAVLYQHHRPDVVRSTLAAYFVAGATLSLVGLGLGGQLDARYLLLALVLSPTLVVGLLVAVPVRRHLPGPAVRSGILLVCAVSAVVLLVRSIS